MTIAAFFLSSGRCGTQWLAKHLWDCYHDRAFVTHEPLRSNYLPRQLLGLKDPLASENASQILNHAQLEKTDYVECGWPCYGAIPHFAKRFRGRVRIVHLPRHPIWSASSMVTHAYYRVPPRRDRLTERALLTPFDAGMRFPEYRQRWQQLNEFEKCLYFWAEVHALGLELQKTLGVPWLRIKSEELFTEAGLARLLAFLELPERDTMRAALGQRVDHFSFKTDAAWDVASIERHPRVVEVAEALGYDSVAADEKSIRERYRAERSGAGPREPAAARSLSGDARCPCGSGLAYRSCHGKPVRVAAPKGARHRDRPR
jgi:hypothetical protein